MAIMSPQKCFIEVIPNEILDLIFRLLVFSQLTDITKRILPGFRLACTCIRWRSLMLAPHAAVLWSEFALDLSRSCLASDEERGCELVSAYLRRSRNMPLTLLLRIDDFTPLLDYTAQAVIQLRDCPLMALLESSRVRWSIISVPTDVIAVMQMKQLVPRGAIGEDGVWQHLLPNVTCVHLVDDWAEVDRSAYSWSDLCKWSGHVQYFEFPTDRLGQWKRLVHLELRAPCYHELESVSACCPSLRDFRLTMTFEPRCAAHRILHSHQPLKFVSLINCDIVVTSDYHMPILDFFECPSLLKLSLGYERLRGIMGREQGFPSFAQYFSSDSIVNLVARSKCSLEDLCCFDLPVNTYDRVRFLSSIPHIRKLRLCLHGCRESIPPTSLIIPDMGKSPILLPRLDTLVLSGFVGWDYNRFIGMLEVRAGCTPLKMVSLWLISSSMSRKQLERMRLLRDERYLCIRVWQRKAKRFAVREKIFRGEDNSWFVLHQRARLL